MTKNLRNLYRQMILEYSENPHNFGEISNATDSIQMLNPTCGDVIKLSIVIENETIQAISFEGVGCTISKASASIMTDLVKGKSVVEAKELSQNFSNMITDAAEFNEQLLGDAAALEGVKEFPARIKCATLGWKALDKLIEEVK